jgi:protein TonB
MPRILKSLSTLQWALALSVLLHGTALTVRLVNGDDFQRAFQDTTLDVVLVNARSDDKPGKPQAIAQVNLAGGGESAGRRLVSTPLPFNAQDTAGNALITRNQRQIDNYQEQQMQLLAQAKARLAVMPKPDPQRKADNLDPSAQAAENKRQQLSKQIAIIERRIQEENSRPRKRYLSPATLGSADAVYYDAMRQKIEDRGTQDFPQVAGRKLYGELMMSLWIKKDGHVLDARVVQSSGNRMLDRLAEAIAQSAGPFGPFTPAMRQAHHGTDEWDLTVHFRFTHDQTLETTLQTDVLTSPAATPSTDGPSGAR